MSKGVSEVVPEKPFKFLVTNFIQEERSFPKGILVPHSNKDLIALVPIGGEIGAEIERCLNISTIGYNGEHKTTPGAVNYVRHQYHAGAEE